jgi:hypothetical protein
MAEGFIVHIYIELFRDAKEFRGVMKQFCAL